MIGPASVVTIVAGIAFVADEWTIVILHHGKNREARDHFTLPLISVTAVITSLLVASAVRFVPEATFPSPPVWAWIGNVLILSGLGLRIWSVRTLGAYFTVRITIQKDHRIVDTGPYRAVRHPSYSAILLAVFGAGLATGNALGLLAACAGAAFALTFRIRAEERELLRAFGNEYERFAATRKRVIPFIL